MELTKRPGLNGNQLKLVAIIAMTIDHVTWMVFPGYSTNIIAIILHCIGRITAPVMCFFIAEGYFYTKNMKKYMLRLLILAILSHFAYNFAFDIPFLPFANGSIFNQTGVIWPFLMGLVAMIVSEKTKLRQWQKIAVVILCCIAAFPGDWSCIATLVIIYFCLHRGDFKRQMLGLIVCAAMYGIVYAIFIDTLYGILQLAVVLAIPFLKLYNGERGKWKGMKWFFYAYYPAHLVLCGLLRLALGN